LNEGGKTVDKQQKVYNMIRQGKLGERKIVEMKIL
jgi:hypothetical protein